MCRSLLEEHSLNISHLSYLCIIIYEDERCISMLMCGVYSKPGDGIYLLTSPPTASRRNESAEEMVASSTSRPSSWNAWRTETSMPGQFLSENTLIQKPFSRVSTVTCRDIVEKWNQANREFFQVHIAYYRRVPWGGSFPPRDLVCMLPPFASALGCILTRPL